MLRFHPHSEPWGRFVDVKINAVEALQRQLRRARPGEVFISSACDGWQPIEGHYQLTRRCCELLLEREFRLNLLTKSDLVVRDFDLFRNRLVRVGVTITTLDERLRELWEPHAVSIRRRLDVIEAARQIGLQTAVMFGPLLPVLSDTSASIAALCQQAAASQIDTIWFDALNPRSQVWPAVAALLRTEFPEIVPHYRAVLFDAAYRKKYLAGLRARIEQAAGCAALTDRITLCM
jgi:DNA repair photolyase